MQKAKKPLDEAKTRWDSRYKDYEELLSYLLTWQDCLQAMRDAYQEILNEQGNPLIDRETKAGYIQQMNSLAKPYGFYLHHGIKPSLTHSKHHDIDSLINKLTTKRDTALNTKTFSRALKFADRVLENGEHENLFIIITAAEEINDESKALKQYLYRMLDEHFPDHIPNADNFIVTLRNLHMKLFSGEDPKLCHWQALLQETLRQMQEAVEAMLQKPEDVAQDVFADLRAQLLSDIDRTLDNGVQATEVHEAVRM